MTEQISPEYDSRLDTIDHIKSVQELLRQFSNELSARGINHDDSKLREPEKSMFDKYVPKLQACVYGSDEYKQNLIGMGEALEHHYAKNSHHPEHYHDGINDMDLLDIIEMFYDWKAAISRMPDGDMRESVEINAVRFSMNDQLKRVFLNTINRS